MTVISYSADMICTYLTSASDMWASAVANSLVEFDKPSEDRAEIVILTQFYIFIYVRRACSRGGMLLSVKF